MGASGGVGMGGARARASGAPAWSRAWVESIKGMGVGVIDKGRGINEGIVSK